MNFILYLIVGGIIGWLAGLILGKNVTGGIVGNILIGIIGAWIGGELFGHFGPTVVSIAIIPALIGSIILITLIILMRNILQ